MTKEELESGISSSDVERTSSIKKQKRDIFGMVFCACVHVCVWGRGGGGGGGGGGG